MGWSGYGIYDGDGTQTSHYDFLRWAGVARTNDEIMENEYLGIKKTKIPREKVHLLKKSIRNIYNKLEKRKRLDEYSAIDYQMFAALLLDNDIKIPKYLKTRCIKATEYLMGEHASDFNNPSARRRVLKNFIERIKNS